MRCVCASAGAGNESANAARMAHARRATIVTRDMDCLLRLPVVPARCGRVVPPLWCRKFTQIQPVATTHGRASCRRREVPPQRHALLERADVDRIRAELAIEEIVAQRARDGAKRELLPGHLVFAEEPHLEALRTRPEIEIDEARAEHDVHL